jgi:anti-anti-sigma factor
LSDPRLGQFLDMREQATTTSFGDLSPQSRVDDASLQLVAAGELDMAAAFDFESRVEALLSMGVRTATLDLTRVDFVDSAGLGALLSVRERAQQLGVQLEIPRVSGPVQRILDLAGISDILAP